MRWWQLAESSLTVLTWFWRQEGGLTAYTAHHVNIWADMVRRHLSLPHRIACVTDIPDGIDSRVAIIAPPREFEDVRIPTWAEERPQCLRRLVMFRPDAARYFGRRFVCMDLDCVISGPLDPLFVTDADFKIYRGTAPKRPYNGSMMLMTAGARKQVWSRFTPEMACEAGRRFIGSDQAWISHVLGPGEQTWGPKDGVFWWGGPIVSDSVKRITFFPGRPKPWELVDRDSDPYVVEHYRRQPGAGRCLILGCGPTLWDDLAAAKGPFDAVIASPEAAEYWRGPILSVVREDDHADRLAAMHGYEPVWCGRSEQMMQEDAA